MANTSNNGSKPHELLSVLTKIGIDLSNNMKSDTATCLLKRYTACGPVGRFTHYYNGQPIVVLEPMFVDGTYYSILTASDVQTLLDVANSKSTDWFTQLAQFIIKDMLMMAGTCTGDLVIAHKVGDDITFTYQNPEQRRRSEDTEFWNNVGIGVLAVAAAGFAIYLGYRNPNAVSAAVKSVV